MKREQAVVAGTCRYLPVHLPFLRVLVSEQRFPSEDRRDDDADEIFEVVDCWKMQFVVFETMTEELSGNDYRSFDYFQSLANHSDWKCKERRKELFKLILYLSFPQKLFLLLHYADNGSVAWCEEDPRSFRIVDKDRLMAEIIPQFFQSKFV